jgi:hypothetical protein
MSPKAVLNGPVVLLKSAAAPTAVFWSAVLNSSAPAPTAVLKLPSVPLRSENQPNAEFAAPVVTLPRALVPSAVFSEPPTLPGSGVSWASICWQSAKQANASVAKQDK